MQESNTPRSSPPPLGAYDSSPPAAPSTRKRSHDETEAADTSSTEVGEHVDVTASQLKPSSSQVDEKESIKPSTAAHSSGMPPLHMSSTMGPPPNKSFRPGRDGHSSRKNNDPTMAASFKVSQASAVEPDQPDSETTLPDEDGSPSSTPAEPQDMIEDFDWRDLEERYHDNVNKLNQNEQKILAEFSSLCKVSTLLSAIQARS